MFVLGATAATYVHGDKYPTEAARLLDGDTHMTAGIVVLVPVPRAVPQRQVHYAGIRQRME